jgi:hypothetical protein
MTRREFLRAGAAGTGILAAAFALGAEACSRSTHAQHPSPTSTRPPNTPVPTPTPPPYAAFRTRPDLPNAPKLHVEHSTGKAAPGLLMLTPSGGSQAGAAMFNNDGKLVWFHPASAKYAHDLQVVRYQGHDALAWFEGDVTDTGYGRGVHLMFDATYQQIARIAAPDGLQLDLHDLVITDAGTAIVDAYTPVVMDLSAHGGAPNTSVFDCRIQEIDIPSGNVLSTWSALDHVGIEESVAPIPKDAGKDFDYFHCNSLAIDRDGLLLMSARNTSALYKIDRKTGDIVWRLCGATGGTSRGRAVQLQPAAESFWFQHDARRNGDGTISIFDDGGGPYHHPGRGLVLRLDEGANTAMLERAYGDALGLHIDYQGSFRHVSNGNWLLGWGNIGRVTEFTADGQICFDANFPGNSYRALRAEWHAQPADLPAVVAETTGGSTSIWASWNGATELARWHVLAGDSADSLQPAGTFDWQDLETQMALAHPAKTVAVEALDHGGKLLARSATSTVAAA